MKLCTLLKGAAVALAALGLVLPSPLVQAAEQPLTADQPLKIVRTDATVLDIGLSAEGTLAGRVVDHTGTPAAGAEVVIRQGQTQVAKTTTNDRGAFAVAGLRGGLYEVGSGQTTGTYRLWTRSAAPDSAKETVLLVLGENGSRGNAGALGAGTLLLAAGIIATVIISAITLSQVNNIPKSN